MFVSFTSCHRFGLEFSQLFYSCMICKIEDDLTEKKFKTLRLTNRGNSLSVLIGGYSGRIKRETWDWSIGMDSFRCG